ncbi:Imidazole glycerol phosphate synthase amidotransferase subunit [hydrothermal vent metagenome]|uniref:Imidazole glycerol phosphate synthase amidotransferase subunit n=1 Tax=hydrothermal vent metagenome TaxID=652676 RepID=A0A3B0YB01_9ZZZZ
MRVGVVDYGVGNVGSVMNAVQQLKAIPVLIDRAINLKKIDSIILPGVGSFSDCMALLTKGGWALALEDQVLGAATPLLGICLGMQLLASSSTEGAKNHATDTVEGLNFIPGTVKHLNELGCQKLVPHIGWNEINISTPNSILKGIPSGTDFYFVHSYAYESELSSSVIAVTDHDLPIAAVINKDHIWGTQFHPEKSSRAGLKLISNFIEASAC